MGRRRTAYDNLGELCASHTDTPRHDDSAVRAFAGDDVSIKGASMTDYWVSKLFFDLHHDAELAAEFRADMAAVMARYEIKPDIRKALLEDDVGKIAPLVNAYLLRFYFQIRGMPESEFIGRLHALQKQKEATHG
jgi:hypothetical protein